MSFYIVYITVQLTSGTCISTRDSAMKSIQNSLFVRHVERNRKGAIRDGEGKGIQYQ